MQFPLVMNEPTIVYINLSSDWNSALCDIKTCHVLTISCLYDPLIILYFTWLSIVIGFTCNEKLYGIHMYKHELWHRICIPIIVFAVSSGDYYDTILCNVITCHIHNFSLGMIDRLETWNSHAWIMGLSLWVAMILWPYDSPHIICRWCQIFTVTTRSPFGVQLFWVLILQNSELSQNVHCYPWPHWPRPQWQTLSANIIPSLFLILAYPLINLLYLKNLLFLKNCNYWSYQHSKFFAHENKALTE